MGLFCAIKVSYSLIQLPEMDDSQRITDNVFFSLVSYRNLDRCTGGECQRMRLYAVGLPCPDVLVASGGNNKAVLAKVD